MLEMGHTSKKFNDSLGFTKYEVSGCNDGI